MKIISVTDNYEKHAGPIAAHIIPDSAILKDGKPFFIPDFSETFTFYPSLVIRINRLGKNISRNFAYRYYSDVTFGITVIADDISKHFLSAGLPNSIANAFDGSAILGEFKEIERFGNINNLRLTAKINNKTVYEFNTNQMILDTDSIIEYLSKYFTLKIGDLVYTGSPLKSKQTLYFNQHITALINDIEVLSFKTK